MSIPRHPDAGADIRSVLSKLRGQQRRLADSLHELGPQYTGALCRELAIGNLSDCALKANRVLERSGFRIVARKPDRPIKNRYGEPSQMHVWELRRVS